MIGGGMGGMLKKVQQMQADMEKAQQELETMEVTGEAGGGLVKITVSCRNQVRRVSIDDSLLNDDREMLEDLVAAALNDSLRKAETTSQEHMAKVTKGIQLPPGFNMPF